MNEVRVTSRAATWGLDPFALPLLSCWEVRYSAPPTWANELSLGATWFGNSKDDLLVQQCGDRFLVSCSELARFAINFETKTVTIFDVYSDASSASVSHILFDQIAPKILAQLGLLVLHASAVEIGGRLALFVGETGAGKSTIAASLACKRDRLVGDDAIVISYTGDEFYGYATYPSLRLYPESVSAIFGDEIESMEMAHYSEKRRLRVPNEQSEQAANTPIGAIFFLDDAKECFQVKSHEIGPREACVRLIDQSFALNPGKAHSAITRFDQVARLADAVNAYELHYSRDFQSLPLVQELIHDLMNQGTRNSSANLRTGS